MIFQPLGKFNYLGACIFQANFTITFKRVAYKNKIIGQSNLIANQKNLKEILPIFLFENTRVKYFLIIFYIILSSILSA